MSVTNIDISQDSYNDKLPQSIVNDPQVISFGNTQDLQQEYLLPFIDKIRVLCNIPNVSEAVLDLLAFQFQVLFYSGTFSIVDPIARLAAKRDLIANSFAFNSTIGTPATLQKILVTLYQNAYVQEWFEYGGTAHHFRILTDNVINDPNVIKSIGYIITLIKRASSYFEGFFTIQTSAPAPLYVATAIYAQTRIQAPVAR